MTEELTAPEAPTDETVDSSTSTNDQPQTEAEQVDIDKLPADLEAAKRLRREAQGLRTRLRETEAERDGHAEQLTALRRQIAESALDGTGITPEALWASAEVAELLAEDGTVDTERVRAAASAAAERFGVRRLPAPNPAQGVVGGAVPSENKWEQAFKGVGKR